MKKTSLFASVLFSAVVATAGSVALAAGGNNGNNNSSNNTSTGTNTTNNTTSTNTSAAPAAAPNESAGAGLASGSDCFTAVYDQQNDEGTTAHYGKGEWDANRQLCMHVGKFTQSFMKDVSAVEAAQANPFIHVMYVIDRTQDKLYAPCGANSDSVGVLSPGTYDLNSLTKVDSNVPNLGAGANCLITG